MGKNSVFICFGLKLKKKKQSRMQKINRAKTELSADFDIKLFIHSHRQYTKKFTPKENDQDYNLGLLLLPPKPNPLYYKLLHFSLFFPPFLVFFIHVLSLHNRAV